MQQEMIALTAIRIARAPVRADWTAMSTTPVTVLVVCEMPSCSTKTRMQTTEITRTAIMKMLMTLPERRS